MKISELTDEQCAKIFEVNPDWVADNRPKWLHKYHRPEWTARFHPEWTAVEVPTEIQELLNCGENKMYKLVTSEQFGEYSSQFSIWFDKKEKTSLFSDSRGICESAIMEYLANKDGLTIY